MKHIVWFKRDCRIYDHEPLATAATLGDVIPLYILEPTLWQQPDMSGRQYNFLCESLTELNVALTKLGQPLIIKVGKALPILQNLQHQFGEICLHTYQETWNNWTYQRDVKILNWCRQNQIQWHEYRQFGVVRRLKSRNGWAKQWRTLMEADILPAPTSLTPVVLSSDSLPSEQTLLKTIDHCPKRQRGGRQRALRILNSFLTQRGEYYTYRMSSPVTAYQQCSRLSPYLAFGCVSMREVYQATKAKQQQLKQLPKSAQGGWPKAYTSFLKRLHWHCHFIQKLETQPSIEYKNLHPALDNLREPHFKQHFFEAWQAGQTGYPFIDACMRALQQTGWINFRMRAMLISFASQHLWLHWQATALVLARLFTDYEPGIHYSQIQMQSSTTGINAIRIYNPIKQSKDQDPNGIFIRKFVPEVAHLNNEQIHEPWLYDVSLANYPSPIIEESIWQTTRSETTI